MSQFRIIYQVVTPESAVDGGYSEQGYYFKGTHYKSETFTILSSETFTRVYSEEYWQEISEIGLDNLIKLAHSLGIVANSSNDSTNWFSSEDPEDPDPDKDYLISYSLHLRSDRFKSLFRRVNLLLFEYDFNYCVHQG
jgi:hypothetical protein